MSAFKFVKIEACHFHRLKTRTTLLENVICKTVPAAPGAGAEKAIQETRAELAIQGTTEVQGVHKFPQAVHSQNHLVHFGSSHLSQCMQDI